MTRAPVEWLLGFARALRGAGLAVTADRERTFLAAVAEVGIADRHAVHAAGRATLTSSPDDAATYDAVFARWFSVTPESSSHRRPLAVDGAATQSRLAGRDGGEGGDGGTEEGDDASGSVRARASATEVLRHRDVATLSAAERQRLTRLFGQLRPVPPDRRARRRVMASNGRVDGPATLREQLRRMGEPGRVHHRRKGVRPRRVVLLVDVSGSMSGYADSLLRLAHAFVRSSPTHVEVFTMGTRLTHVTKALRERRPDRALLAAGATVPDWSGGTRLGEALSVFLDRWGRRGMARGSVVVVFSDGWEREGPDLLGEQMRRLAGLAHRVVWASPHRGRPGYEPVQRGIVAVLPHVDDFVAGHSFAAFEELLEVVARA